MILTEKQGVIWQQEEASMENTTGAEPVILSIEALLSVLAICLFSSVEYPRASILTQDIRAC